MRRFALIGLVAALAYAAEAPAAVLCRQKKTGRITARDTACKKKETALDLRDFGAVGPAGTPGTPGTPGQPGAPGADGQLRIYGDGSAGARTFNAGGFIAGPAESQFTDLTIASLVGVPSGAVIRCTGNLTITAAGSLAVDTGVSGGFTFSSSVDANTLTFGVQPAHPGWSTRFAVNGEVSASGSKANGGFGGNPVPELAARWLLMPGIFGGGGGANSTSGAGGAGGGSVVFLVQGTFTNAGAIRADGQGGSGNAGAGAGGIVVIASRTAVVNTGTIAARGGNSQNLAAATAGIASGGGGGGGIVHLLAPAVTAGTVDVSGGSPGTVPSNASSPVHTAGGGGGGCGGSGGSGGDVPAGNPTNPEQGTTGSPGLLLVDQVDPTALF